MKSKPFYMESGLIIQRGTVWHTYTMQCPEINLSKRMIKSAMRSGLFLSSFDHRRDFYFFNNDELYRSHLDFEFNPDVTGMKITGLPLGKKYKICDFTMYSAHMLSNKLLSQAKILQADGTFYSDFVFFALKPFFFGVSGNKRVMMPIVNIYGVGIAQVNFIDLAEYNDDLKSFIQDNVNYSFKRFDSITTSLEYAKNYLAFDNKISPLWRRIIDFRYLKKIEKEFINNSEFMRYCELSLTGKYVDYMKSSNVKHGLSDIARTIVAMIYTRIIKVSCREIFSGIDTNKYYSGWQGKPNIYVLKHDNQKSKASLNWSSNKGMINALLAKSAHLYQETIPFDYKDYRMFDDFNYFSSHGVSLSVLSRKALRQFDNDSGFTMDNFKWDSLVKSDLREIVSFFYEGVIFKINNIDGNLELAKIKRDVFEFEEWLRSTSRRSGEIHSYALSLFEHDDIRQSRKSVDSLIKTKMELIKIRETEADDKANRNLTLIFGLIATTSISPILIKPVFERLKFNELIKDTVFNDFSDGIYFLITSLIVYALIQLMNKEK